MGKAIAARRSKIILATKVLDSHLRYDQVLRAADESLRRLSVDCINLYQIHWPNHSIPIADTMRAMEELVDAGKVRYVGVSNFSTRELREAQGAMTRYPIVSNQVLYNLNSRRIEEELLPYCQEHHVTIIADGSLTTPLSLSYGPSAQGHRAGGGPLWPKRLLTSAPLELT